MLLAAHESRREILGSRSRFMLPTVAPGQNYGSAPYRQLCPAYPFANHSATNFRRDSSPRDRAKGSAGTFQRGKFPEPCYCSILHRKRISQQVCRKASAQSCGTHGTQQAWMNSRNPTTIATGTKHRQPIFLHPTVEDGTIKRKIFRRVGECARLAFMRSRGLLAESVSSLYTKSFPFH